KWGIPLPVDESQTIYVWFDALINYISAIGYADDGDTFSRYWPANLHVIGKDITRFHCVLWPAMLMSAGVDLPACVLGHGFVSFKGERMSKSLGNILNPLDVVEKFGPDPLRYYLLKEVPLDRDGDFSWELFIERYNADLANDLGNLVSRTLAMIVRYNGGRVEELWVSDGKMGELQAVAETSIEEYLSHMEGLRIDRAVQSAWKLIKRANQYIQETAPWQLAKQETNRERLLSVLNALLESIRIVSVLLFPIMPGKSVEMWKYAGFSGSPDETRIRTLAWSGKAVEAGRTVGQATPLFPRISS
ncbi:MAG: class I tRNA ligase family protein, partial [Candidatus Eisenbacteria bacterium]